MEEGVESGLTVLSSNNREEKQRTRRVLGELLESRQNCTFPSRISHQVTLSDHVHHHTRSLDGEVPLSLHHSERLTSAATATTY